MVTGRQRDNWRGYGEIQFHESSPTAFSKSGDGIQHFDWIPRDDVQAHVYGGFRLPLADHRSGSQRLIGPRGGFATKSEDGTISESSFFHVGRLGGLGVLRARGLSPGKSYLADFSLMIIHKVMESQTWPRRQIGGSLDLKLSPPMQKFMECESLVPVATESGQWTINDLLRAGKTEAESQGINEPCDQTIVQLGLYAGAKQSPLPVTEMSREEIQRIVRSAFIDITKSPLDIPDEDLLCVERRFVAMLKRHLDHELPKFNKWLVGANNSIAAQIANRKTPPGRDLESSEVAAAFGQLAWRSLTLWGQCTEAQMRCVAADLPNPLSAENFEIYKAIYFRQPWLGGDIPLCMLAGRLRLLTRAECDLVERPNCPITQGVILRLLSYYGCFVSDRREVDRKSKQLKNRKHSITGLSEEQISLGKKTSWGA